MELNEKVKINRALAQMRTILSLPEQGEDGPFLAADDIAKLERHVAEISAVLRNAEVRR